MVRGGNGGRASIEATVSLRFSVRSLRTLRMGILGEGSMTFNSSYDGEWTVPFLVDTRDRWAPFLECDIRRATATMAKSATA